MVFQFCVVKYFARYSYFPLMNNNSYIRFSNRNVLLKNWYLRPVSNVHLVLRVVFAVFRDANWNEDIFKRPPSKAFDICFLQCAWNTPRLMDGLARLGTALMTANHILNYFWILGEWFRSICDVAKRNGRQFHVDSRNDTKKVSNDEKYWKSKHDRKHCQHRHSNEIRYILESKPRMGRRRNIRLIASRQFPNQ